MVAGMPRDRVGHEFFEVYETLRIVMLCNWPLPGAVNVEAKT